MTCAHGWLAPEVEMRCLDATEVVFQCEENPSTSVRFAERHAATNPLDRRLFFAVEAHSPALTARLEGVTNIVTGRGLARFVERLETHPEGSRWANADDDLALTAARNERGLVELTWTLRPWRRQYHGWHASVLTSLAVNSLAARAGQLHDFLTADGFGVVEYYEA